MNCLSAVFPNYAVHFFMSPQDGNVANSIQHYVKCLTKTLPHRAFSLHSINVKQDLIQLQDIYK